MLIGGLCMVQLSSRLWLLNMIFLPVIASQAPHHYQHPIWKETELERSDYALLLSSVKNEQLLDACSLNNVARAQHLLKNGASLTIKNRRGREPIHLAALNGYTSMVKLLLDFKANINAQDYEKTKPLHVAAYNGHAETVSLLLERGAFNNVHTSNEFTPVHYAARRGHPEALCILLNHEFNGLEEPYNELKKINAIATISTSLSAEIISIIIAYKGLDRDTPLVQNHKKGILSTLFSPLDLFAHPIINHTTESYPIASAESTTCFGETALTLAAQSLTKENDPEKLVALKECVSLLEKQPERIIKKLIQRALEHNV